MVKKIIFFGMLTFALAATAQRSPMPPNSASAAATASPTANAYNRQNQVPVNHYTGMPQIEVPIYTYNGPNLQHSVGLSYFAGGVKLAEVAPSTGLGWSLTAGGAITRTVQGLPDDSPVNGWLYSSNISFTGSQQYSTRTSPMNPPNRDHYYEDNIDSQWDIFQFNANGLSGKFYLGKDGSFAVSPLQKIKIQYQLNPSLNVTTPVGGGSAQGSTIESFTITDDDGTRYIFNEREITLLASPGATSGLYGRAHVSAWYLSTVISPFNEDTILITYQNTLQTRTVNNPASYMDCLDCAGSAGDQLNAATFGTSTVAGKRIKTINFPDRIWLDFVYDATQRCDLPGDNALREINIRDTGLRGGHKLDYLYFTELGEIAYNSACTNQKQDFRLQLKSVTAYTPQANNPPYVFHYEQSNNLPSINSNAQDHWGGFNGAFSNTHLVNYTNLASSANRTANTTFAASGLLKAVQNPAGGTTVIEFEPNQRYMPVLQASTARVGMSNPASQSIPYRRSSLGYLTRFTYRLGGTGGVSSPTTSFCMLNITITPRNGSTITGSAINKSMPLIQVFHGGFFADYDFPSTTDNLLVTWTSVCTGQFQFSVSISWDNETSVETGSLSLTGGLRVRSVSEFDGINAKPVSVREFRYQLANGFSSGFINNLPKYTTDMRLEEVINTSGGISSNNYRVANAGPVNFQHYTQGSPVGYARVEEFYGTIQNNIGRTLYEFSSYNNANYIGTLNQNQFPYLSEQVQEWMLGLPLREQQFDADNRLKTETVNEYNNRTSTTHLTNAYNALKLGVSTERLPFTGITPSRLFAERFFHPVIGTAELTKTIDITHEPLDTIRTETTYEYDPVNYVPVKTISSSSRKRNQLIETNTYYPFHYTGITTGPIQTMKTAGMLIPVASETWVKDIDGTRLMDAEVTEFQTVNGNQIRPLREFSLEAAAPVPLATIGAFNPSMLNRNNSFFKAVSEQTVFNTKGVALETRNLITDQYNAVITDFDAMVPVSKVDNARESEIAYSSFETGRSGNWTYSGLPVTDPIRSVMGMRYYPLSTGSITKNNIPSGKNYLITFWTRSGTVSVSGATLIKTEANSSTGWAYNEYQTAGGTAISITGSAHIDELRLYPVAATMVTENFIPATGLISACDANNKIAFNEYDGLNRLRLQRDQDNNIIKAFEYRFASSTTLDRNAVWQDEIPLTLQCEKLGATQYNTGNQLKLQRDVNPASFTNQAHRWLSIGANATACPVIPDWQDNGVTECVLNTSGVRTGEQRKQQRDANPVSPTFNQLRWVSLGVNGNCNVVTTRAHIEFRNVETANSSGTYSTTANVYIVLRNSVTNQPVNGTNLQVNYFRRSDSNGYIQTTNHVATINNASEVQIYSGIISEYDSGFNGFPYFYALEHGILAGAGYIL